jgi:hypothetical protein
MSAWGRRVAPRLSSLGIDADMVISEEERADALRFITKDEEGALILRVDVDGAEVGLELPPVRIASDVVASRMLASLESLPEQFVVRVGGEEIVAQGATLDLLETGSWIGWVIPKRVVIEHAELLDDQLEDALVALAGVALVTAPPARVMPKAPRLTTSATRRARSALLAKGAQVQVLHGPFAGKVGVIVELDGKDGARVALGLLETRMSIRDLALAEGGRPKLGTSHRRIGRG